MYEEWTYSSDRGIPYAEIMMRPGDLRPVICRIEEMGAGVEISDGTADDLAELLAILSLMRAVVQSVLNVRMMKEAYPRTKHEFIGKGDEEPPF